MATRTIDCQSISGFTPLFDKAKAWLEDNDIDPTLVPLESEFVVGEETITYERIVTDAEGRAKPAADGEHVLRETVTISKHSSPETYGL